MGIFNNVGNIATNIGSNIVGSAISKMVGNLSADQDEKSWYAFSTIIKFFMEI